MAILIDPPQWPAHGRTWSHLISDTSYAELHAFAEAHGIPARGFEGDHYDVPGEMYAPLVAAGATPVGGSELVRALRDSGLRLQKRRGEKGVARATSVAFPDGTTADIDLIESRTLAPEARVFASMVFVSDAVGHQAVTYSPRRQEWGAPGGWREGEESVFDTAVREAAEEVGLLLDPLGLEPCGYERFHPHGEGGLWRSGQDILQVFRTRIDHVKPPLGGDDPTIVQKEWVTVEEFAMRCEAQFWWPLADRVLSGRLAR